jgi:hypothetical protein
MSESKNKISRNIFDLERWGLYISQGKHYNVNPKHVYRLDFEGGVVELPGVSVFDGDVGENDSNSPIPEVEFMYPRLTGRGYLALATIVIGGLWLASSLKLIP